MITLISDFSKTLTVADKPTTWSSLGLSGILGETYGQRRNTLFQANHKYELAGNREKTNQWFAQHLQLMVDSGLNQDHINELVQNNTYFEPRSHLIDLMHFCSHHRVNLIIITSGIQNFVEAFLVSLGINTSDITIIGNTLTVENNSGKINGYRSDSVFSPLESKAQFEKSLQLPKDDLVFLLGDKSEDLDMCEHPYKTIGFNENIDGFDINLGKQGDLLDVIQELKKVL